MDIVLNEVPDVDRVAPTPGDKILAVTRRVFGLSRSGGGFISGRGLRLLCKMLRVLSRSVRCHGNILPQRLPVSRLVSLLGRHSAGRWAQQRTRFCASPASLVSLYLAFMSRPVSAR